MEEWLPINGNPRYAISNLGNVKNTRTNKLLKVYPSRLMTVRRVFVRDLTRTNIYKFLSNTVYIPNPNLLGSPRSKYYVSELREAYAAARQLLENNIPNIM